MPSAPSELPRTERSPRWPGIDNRDGEHVELAKAMARDALAAFGIQL
jgi:hypothetical protein